jgi:hypothetical protein
MIKSFINTLTGKAQEKLKDRSRRTHLAMETLESRDVPSAAPDAFDLAPVVTVAPILNTEGSANTWTLSSLIAGSHTITSPNGLSTVTIINETNGDVPASPSSSSSTQVFENGVLVWQQSSALVGEALFSPDSQHLALVVDTSSGWEVIEDGSLVGNGYSSVSLLTFSQDGNDLAFITYGTGTSLEADGYEVVENGSVVSNRYYAIGDLQFNSPGDQLSFAGYQSQSVPTGILPQFIEFNYVPLTSVGEWGYVVSYDGPTISTPTDPVTVDVPSGAAPSEPVSNTGSTPTNPVQTTSQPSPTAPVSNSAPAKITPTNTVTVSKTTDPPKTVTLKTTPSTSGSHKTTSSGATEVDSKVSKDTPKGNDLLPVTLISPPASRSDGKGMSKSNSSRESGVSTLNSSNHELSVVVPLFDHTEDYLSPVLVDASQSTNKDDEED